MRQVRRRPPAGNLDDPESGPQVADESHRRLLARDALEHAIARLPENQQDVIRLYWFEHLPYAEIARRLGASESAVKVRAHRAYKTLRAILEEGSNFDGGSSILRST